MGADKPRIRDNSREKSYFLLGLKPHSKEYNLIQTMKLFLDDIRNPKDCVSYMYRRIGSLNLLYLEDWFIVRNFEEFKTAFDSPFPISHVSFDHDLAEAHYHESMYQGGKVYMKYLETVSEKTGLDCAKWMKQYYEDRQLKLPVMFVHSMNPVGTQNIIDLFNDKRTSQEGSPEPSN